MHIEEIASAVSVRIWEGLQKDNVWIDFENIGEELTKVPRQSKEKASAKVKYIYYIRNKWGMQLLHS